ncbi:MAG TPA: glycine cleavage system aminomethyltransferase GcvT [Anaerolineae bacterium]|nr:glycine cleavage system aminomethyltransferase GcvT [Anaerolineae bacterium]
MGDYGNTYFGARLPDADPELGRIVALEEERQARRIILIPSESIAPAPVREALGSVFTNIYAEGYPPLRMTRDDEELVLDLDHQLAYYRRYADRRFYKGADYVHFVETLAQRRCAACFANGRASAKDIYVNVQPLSGAAANLAVYDALMEAGDTLMGMDLFQGGHLTHGSEFNISGRRYRVVSYGVDRNGRLDYNQIMDQALAERPKVIVAGYTSYPWAPDWHKFREVADACGAYLMADIAHPAGMASAGVYPNPVGIADVITFTTHKTMCGPRGAVIMTTDEDIANLIDMAVFPGAQGGPHTNKFAAMAVAFHIAQTDVFKQMMHGIFENAQALAAALEKRDLGLAYGGTDTHLLLVDLRSIETPTGEPLRGEMAVRIMELAGLIANKNTIPGDELTALGSGVRLGTPWVTQRGMGPEEMDTIADAINRLLRACHPFHYDGLVGELPRAKLDLDVLEAVKRDVAALAARSAAETGSLSSGYPHYSFLDEAPTPEDRGLLLVSGWRAKPFLQEIGTADISSIEPNEQARTLLLDRGGKLIDDVDLLRLVPEDRGRDRYVVATHGAAHERIKAWFRGLSDGYVLFDDDDLERKVQGPVTVQDLDREGGIDAAVVDSAQALRHALAGGSDGLPAGADALALYEDGRQDLFCLTKPYFVGQAALASVRPGSDKREFVWQEPEDATLRRTPLFETHRGLTRKIIPFAGWEMPVWYTSVGEEHQAVREAAGLFDVAHMGVLEIAGPHAATFLDTVTTNYARWLDPGQSQYAYLLDPDGNVIDDIMVYCRDRDRYLVVVNAANAEKDWAWLNAVNEGQVVIDCDNRALTVEGKALVRDLKDPAHGLDQRVDLALQGPASLSILQALTDDQHTKDALARVRRTDLIEVTLSSLDLVIARTGYTGEEWGYEIFVHPDRAVEFWNLVMDKGARYGVKPCGLAARDSTRIEAGLPLYGHELAGPLDILPHEAGFSGYVKFHKPFFVGRKAALERAAHSERVLVRFQVDETGVKALRGGDHGETVVNKRGKYVGRVTSCTLVGGTQVGLALVEQRYAEPDTALAIYPAASGKGPTVKAPDDLTSGDSAVLPVWATVLPRFPEREGRMIVESGD